MPLAAPFLALALTTLAASPSPGPALTLERAFVAAGPKLPELETAQTQLEEGDFDAAVKTLQGALNGADLSDDQLVEIYRLLGLSQLYLGNEDKAREAYEKLLQARPDYEIPKSAPPKIRALYGRIREDIKKRRVRPVTLTAEPIPPVEGNRPLAVNVRVEDLALGAKAKLYFRRAGAQSFSSVDFVKPKGSRDQYGATVPAFELPSEGRAYEVEYYVEVADAAQRRLAGKGDAFNPLVFTVKSQSGDLNAAGPTDDDAWYKNPVVYVVGGVVLAGATAGAIVLATQPRTSSLPITIAVRGQ